MNRRLRDTNEQMQRIETEITALIDEAYTAEHAWELQKQLLSLHREAQELMAKPVLGVNAHTAGMIIGVLGGIVIFMLLTLKKKGDT